MSRWTGIVIHHTAGVDTGGLEWEDIRRHHVMVNGWSDIGYHFVVEQVENAFVAQMARPAFRTGAHARGANVGNLGVAFVGNFMEEPPPRAQLEVGANLVASLVAMNDIDVADISRHCETGVAVTDCPGDRFPFDEFMDLVVEKL